MNTIEERAERAEKDWLLSDDVTRYGYAQGYIKGATDQQKIDIDKACEYLKNECYWLDAEHAQTELAKFRKAMED